LFNAYHIPSPFEQVQAPELHPDDAWFWIPFKLDASDDDNVADLVPAILLRAAPDDRVELLSDDLLRDWNLHFCAAHLLLLLFALHCSCVGSTQHLYGRKAHKGGLQTPSI
jgi:hypothetical protein